MSVGIACANPEISHARAMKVLSACEWNDTFVCGGCTSTLKVEYDDLDLVKLFENIKLIQFTCPICHSINKANPPTLVIERLESDARAVESDEDSDTCR